MKTPRYKVKDEVYVIRKDKIVKDTIIKIEIENYVEENGYYIVNEFTTIKYITIE
jgi:capsular polysaccharide biosynthesis protein